MEKGFYFAYELNETATGLSFHAVYDKEEKDFQIGLMIGNLTLAIGYTF